MAEELQGTGRVTGLLDFLIRNLGLYHDVTMEMLMVCLENLGKVARETTAYSQ